MKIEDLNGFGSYGSVVHDVDFDSEDEWNEVKKIHSKSLLTIIKVNEKINHKKFYSLVRNIGKFDYKPNTNTNLAKSLDKLLNQQDYKIMRNFVVDKDCMHLQRVTALRDEENLPLGSFDDGELLWHANHSGRVDIIPGIALMGFQSMRGSATGFNQSADYYENLSDSFKSELKEMIVVHNYREGRVNPKPVSDQDRIYEFGFCPEKNSRLPLVIKSPSGITGLHLGLNTFDYIEGMSRNDSDKLLDKIKKDLFTDEYIYDYWWENDKNILLFDNSITLHRRLMKNSSGDRIAYRIPYNYDSVCEYYKPYFQSEFNELKSRNEF